MTFALSGCAAEQVAPDAVYAVTQVGGDDALAVVPVQNDQSVGRERGQECRQFGVERGKGPLVAVASVSAAAKLGQDVTVVVQLPEVEEEKPRGSELGGPQPPTQVRPPGRGEVGRSLAEMVPVKSAIEAGFREERAAYFGVGLIAARP